MLAKPMRLSGGMVTHMGRQRGRAVEGKKRASSVSLSGDSAGVDDTTIYSTERAAGILLVLTGMALQWASLHSITFFDTVVRVGSASGSSSAWVVNSTCTFAVFLVLFFVSRRMPSLLEKKYSIPFMSICLIVGMACLALGSFVVSSVVMIYAGNALIACGTTPLIIVWGEMYKYLNPKGEQLFVTLVAIVLSVAVYLVEIHLPQAIAVLVFAVLPFGSLVALVKARTLLEGTSGTWGAKSKSAMEKSPALFFVCIVVFSIPYNYLRGGDEMQAVLANAADWSNVLAIAIVVMIAAALAEYAAERNGLLLVPSFVLFLLSAAMVVHLFFRDVSILTVPSFLYAGYYLFLAMVYLALGPLVATTDANPTRLFSSAMLANVGGLLLGSLLGSIELWVGEQVAAMAVMVITYVIFFAGCVLLYNRSYSIFRVNFYDESKYSFEYLVPIAPIELLSKGGGGEAVADEATKSLLDAITAQCDAARELYGLSAREHEVLIALVRGRTIASIAEELFVSENTAKAHTKAIYRKLEVHTREELLNRVQDVPRSERGL